MSSMPTLMVEKKLDFLVKYEFEDRKKLKIKGFLWNFPTIRILMQGKKQRLLDEYSSTSAMFSKEILTEENELVETES